ncbi:MAG: hypothetical protein U0270_25140 [Labilithrix sp.]
MIAFALPACGDCGKKKEPTVVIVDDGGDHSRQFRRHPFDRHRDGGIPRFVPRSLGSADAEASDSPAPGQ